MRNRNACTLRRGLPLGLALMCAALAARPALAQSSYAWIGPADGLWTTSTNWTPGRVVPASTDRLLFSGSAVVSGVPTEDIGMLVLTPGASVNLKAAATGTVLTIRGGPGTDLDVPSGSSLLVSKASMLTIMVATGATGAVAGSVTYADAPHQMDAQDPGGITFQSGSNFTQGLGVSGNVFTSAGTPNAIVFASGSTFISMAGANPFALTAPSSKVVFQTGSLYSHRQAGGLSLSGRTYGNFELSSGAVVSVTAFTNPWQTDRLEIKGGCALNLNHVSGSGTGTIVIRGDWVVDGTMAFSDNPTVAYPIKLAGTGPQLVGGTGSLSFSRYQRLSASNPAGVTTLIGFSVPCPLDINTGSLTVNAPLSLQSGARLQVTPFTTLFLAAPFSNSGTVDVYGTLQISPGGTMSGLSANYATASELRYAPGGTYPRRAEWSGTVPPWNVRITGGTALDIGAGGGGAATVANDLTVELGSMLSMNGLISPPMTQPLTIKGNLNLDGTIDQSRNPGGVLALQGNWNQSAGGTLSNHGQVVRFEGDKPQTIGRTGATPSIDFGAITLQKTANSVVLACDVNVNASMGGDGLRFDGTLDVLDLDSRSLALAGTVGGTNPNSGLKTSPSAKLTLQGSGSMGYLRFSGLPEIGTLVMNRTGGGAATLATDLKVQSALYLTAGDLVVPGNITIGAGVPVYQAAGHVDGMMTKYILPGSGTTSFELGSGSRDFRIDLAFTGVPGMGLVAARTYGGDHYMLGSSGIDPARSVNRYYQLFAGVSFSSCDATFRFDPSDRDPASDYTSFVVRKFSSGAWTAPATGARTPTSTQALGLTSFSEFAIGNPAQYALAVTVSGSGTVTKIPDRPAYDAGSVVELHAYPGAGYAFTGWSGSLSGGANPAFLTMDGNKSVLAAFADVQAPSVTVGAPNGGEEWTVGTTQFITWTATDNTAVTSVDLDYSTDGGATYPHSIAAGKANSGSYPWLVPDTPTAAARVRVTARDAVSNAGGDASDLSFTIRPPGDIVAAISPGICLSSAHPCVAIPVDVTRHTPDQLRAYSVTVRLSPELALCAPEIEEGSYLSGAGGGSLTHFEVVDNHDGSWTVDCAILGLPCGATTAGGTLFTVHVGSTSAGGTGTVSVESVTLRDCDNGAVAGFPGAAAAIAIDNLAPAGIAALTAAQRTSGNVPGDSTTAIQLSWPAVESGASVELWRRGFGNYPEYDDPPGAGAAPSAPVGYPPAGWTLAATVGAGTTHADHPATRDQWYYVAYAVDGCGNVSAVSNLTGGTLNYHLGDVANGSPGGTGNNRVGTEDVSLLGMNYGSTGAAVDMVHTLDVGPTTDHSTNGRPTTDNRLDFEDLMMFAINFGTVSAPAMRAHPVAAVADASANIVGIAVPALPGVGETFAVSVTLESAGDVQGVSLDLKYDPAVVEPVGVEPGALLDEQRAPSLVLSSRPGNLDAALLGTDAVISGAGELARARFRVKAIGAAGVALGHIEARDAANHTVPIGVPASSPEVAIARTGLGPVYPNPFRGETTVSFALRQSAAARIAVFDVSGRRVRTLLEGLVPAGAGAVSWDGRDESGALAAPGLYVIRLEAGQVVQSRRVLLLK